MKAILVDDEPIGMTTLKKMLELHCPDLEIAATCTNAFDAEQKIKDMQPNVVFLDVKMPGKSGLDLLEGLTEKNFEVVFVTAHYEYMLQALRFSATDYLLKPVDEDELVEAVQRVKQRLRQGKNDRQIEALQHNISKAGFPMEMRLCLPTQKGFTIVKLDEIIYCEAQRSYTEFHLINNKNILVSKPLFDYERLLSGTVFLRVHKSYLINMLHVKEYIHGGRVIMSNDIEIEVSRRKKDQFLDNMKEYFRY
jgi:two-component system, LytTR family, response regulator